MTKESARGLRELAGRFADPLSWTLPEKCLLIAGIYGTFSLWYYVVMSYAVRHPEAAPYLDQAFLPTALRVQTLTIAAWSITGLLALLARWKRTEPRALLALTVVLALYELTYGAHFFGLHTNMFGGLTIVASAAVGWVLLDRRVVNAAAAVLAVTLIALAVLEQGGYLRYAPFFREAPFRDGVLDSTFLISMGGVTVLMMIFIVVIVYLVIARWHARENELAVTSQELARANDVISRYVASQLAEQIRAGNYEGLDRHERRRLTLFFSDIEEFANTADHAEPEDLAEALNEYLSEMAHIGQRHGGTIDKFAGDAVMIFFGAPAPMEEREQGLHAVEMAIEMQERLVALREKWKASGFEWPFHVRMGINTGRASIGNFGSKERADYTAIGRQVNLASRLQAQCERDRILISHSTYVLVQDRIDCTSKGEITVKGFRDPVTVYEVVGRRS